MDNARVTLSAIKEAFSKISTVRIIDDFPPKKSPLAEQELFYDYHRTHGTHKPDLFIDRNQISIPVEIKSEKELHGAGKYSRAHLYSFLKQTIYGQCFSYADLYRSGIAGAQGSDRMCIILIVPQIVMEEDAKVGPGNIEMIFEAALQPDTICMQLMNVKAIHFLAPSFVHGKKHNYGYLTEKHKTYLMTEILYEI